MARPTRQARGVQYQLPEVSAMQACA